MLAEKAFPPEPAYMHYDSTTPNLIVAVGQVSEIASAVREQLAAQGMVPVQWEIETIKGFCPGTIDVLLMRDGREPILGDVKTGVTIGAGAWLQLGAYFDSYQQTFPNTRFPLMPDPREGGRDSCPPPEVWRADQMHHRDPRRGSVHGRSRALGRAGERMGR